MHQQQRSPEARARYAAHQSETRRAWSAERREAEYEHVRRWRDANRDLYLAGSRRWYSENAEHVRAVKLAAYRADPKKFMQRNLVRKARARDAVCEHGPGCVTKDFLVSVYTAECLYCAGPAEHADHFIPLALGGLHCRDNVVPACAPCNLSKHATDPMAWIEARAS